MDFVRSNFSSTELLIALSSWNNALQTAPLLSVEEPQEQLLCRQLHLPAEEEPQEQYLVDSSNVSAAEEPQEQRSADSSTLTADEEWQGQPPADSYSLSAGNEPQERRSAERLCRQPYFVSGVDTQECCSSMFF